MRLVQFILLLVLFNSCEKEVKIDLNTHNPKLVVNCLFNPDTTFAVYVGQSISKSTSTIPFIDNATIILSKNNIKIDTLVSISNGWYSSTFYPEHKAIYQIEVQHEIDTVFAHSSVPDSVQNFSGTYELIVNQSQSNSNPYYEIEYIYSFDDPVGSNYYQLMEGNVLVEPANYQNITDPSISADSEISFNPGSLFFSDSYFDGTNPNITVNIVHYGGIGGNPGPFQGQLKSVSEEYYLFLKSWAKHRFNQNSSTNLDDPLTLIFQGEPSELYTNIEGGYGIFAGYTVTSSNFDYIP